MVIAILGRLGERDTNWPIAVTGLKLTQDKSYRYSTAGWAPRFDYKEFLPVAKVDAAVS